MTEPLMPYDTCPTERRRCGRFTSRPSGAEERLAAALRAVFGGGTGLGERGLLGGWAASERYQAARWLAFADRLA
jgi:hypothetical protein